MRIIYEFNSKAKYLKRYSPATDNNAIIALLLQHQEDNFSELTDENRSKIDCNKSVPKKWQIISLQEWYAVIAIFSPPEYKASISRHTHLALAMQWLEEDEMQNLEKKEKMIMRDGDFSTMIQHQEED